MTRKRGADESPSSLQGTFIYTPRVPCEVKANSATRDAWVRVVHETQPEYGPWLPPDGPNISVLISDGRTEALGHTPRLSLSNRGTRFGDLLWTGEDIKVASKRLVDA